SEGQGYQDAGANGHGVGEGAALSRGGALFFFDGPLAIDAVAGERQRLEALVSDRLPAALAVPVAALVELLQGGDDLFPEPLGAVAELEQELPVIGRRGLVSEIFRGVVIGTLAVEHVLADFFDELPVLLLQLLAELGDAILLHAVSSTTRR